MITREELTELVQQIGDDQLEMAFERLRPLVHTAKQQNGATHEEPEETLVFIVPYRPGGRVHLPIRVPYEPAQAITMTISEPSQEALLSMQRFRDNVEWWNKYRYQIVQDASLVNKFVALSQGKVFTGADYLEAREKAVKEHPQDTPYIFFLHPSKNE